ncbi:MAG TPA: S8 family serine peptidase [Blastocatellia bacterium]|nr:S8 family serine peptidase [Blastocatellia bacterium]
MNRLSAAAIVVAICILSFLPAAGECQSQSERPAQPKLRRASKAIPNRYIVVFSDPGDGVDKTAIDQMAAELTLAHSGSIKHTYRHAIEGFSAEMTEAAAVAISEDPRVKYVAEDSEVSIQGTQLNAPWGLDRIDQRNLPCDGSYTYANAGAGVNVYVIDSGIRQTHQEFSGRAHNVADFVGDGQNGYDCNGHGTAVASVVAGNTFGVAKYATVYSLRAIGCLGYGYTSDVVAAVDWVTANHIKPAVVNMSLGGGRDDSLEDAIRRSIQAGVTYVVAAGNDSMDASAYAPAAVTEAITVGASDETDHQASFSNYGPVVDLYAPGTSIPCAWNDSDTASISASGTSLSAPLAAGVTARYLHSHPSATPAQVSAALTSYATIFALHDPGPGSPNLLLHSNFVRGATAPGQLEFSDVDFSCDESGGSATITVARRGGTYGTVSVRYATTPSSGPYPATAGADYLDVSGYVTFADGDATSETFTVPILSDSLSEFIYETVGLTLSDPTGGATANYLNGVSLFIKDDDPQEKVTISDAAVAEGNAGTTDMVFTVRLSAPTGFTVSVNYETANGTANGGGDYQYASGTVSFRPGETKKIIIVKIYGDTRWEPNETLFVNLSSPWGITIADGQGVGTILNDDK